MEIELTDHQLILPKRTTHPVNLMLMYEPFFINNKFRVNKKI